MTNTGSMRRAGIILPLVGAMLSAVSCREDQAVAPTDPGTVATDGPALAAAAAAPLSFYQVSGGNSHTCGVTMDNRLYCWGWNNHSQLGDGTSINRRKPVPVQSTLRFREVSATSDYTCALTMEYRAYCWGYNPDGNLGNGTTEERSIPMPVAGGRQYRQLDANFFHTCGVGLTDLRAYCWGANVYGQIGDGTRTRRLTPVPVAAALRFRQVSAGFGHTCGTTTDNKAYCWGDNHSGQIGDRSEVSGRSRPTLVADGYQFRQLDAGSNFTCAVTTGKRAYCWGNGRHGEFGNGRTYLSFYPRPVSGGLSLERVSAGATHACGESTTNRAYCWGEGGDGQLGDGTNQQRLTPVAVAGGLFFSQVSAGYFHTCGRTDAGKAYCWGDNFVAQLGDGTTQDRWRPAAVVGP